MRSSGKHLCGIISSLVCIAEVSVIWWTRKEIYLDTWRIRILELGNELMYCAIPYFSFADVSTSHIVKQHNKHAIKGVPVLQ